MTFDSTKSLDVRAIFLVISSAFDKVWHYGLIFKMRKNGVSGRLLKLFQNYLNNWIKLAAEQLLTYFSARVRPSVYIHIQSNLIYSKVLISRSSMMNWAGNPL